MSNGNNKIALFIDFENLETGVRKQFEMRANVDAIIDEVNSAGAITIRRAYGDWVQHANYRHSLMQSGVELVERPNISPGRNGADIKLAVDAIEAALRFPDINTFAIVSGNSDFLPLIQKLREYGRTVIILGVQACTSNLLRKNCDKYVSYESVAKIRKGEYNVPESALKLLTKVIKLRQERGNKTDAAGLKSQMRQMDSSFNERDYGFNSFGDFLSHISKKSLIPLKRNSKEGVWVLEGDEEKPEWEDREMTEEEWEVMLEAVKKCNEEGAGKPNQGKLWIVNAYLHRKRLDGLLPLANNILFDGLQLLVKEGVLVRPTHDTYHLADGFEDKKEEFLDELFGEVIEDDEDETGEAEEPEEKPEAGEEE